MSEDLNTIWIPVAELLPERGERVMISSGTGFVCEAYLSDKTHWMRHGCYVDFMAQTHWMPLPKPPKEATP